MLEIIGELLNSPDDINILGCSYIYITKKNAWTDPEGGGGDKGSGPPCKITK